MNRHFLGWEALRQALPEARIVLVQGADLDHSEDLLVRKAIGLGQYFQHCWHCKLQEIRAIAGSFRAERGEK